MQNNVEVESLPRECYIAGVKVLNIVQVKILSMADRQRLSLKANDVLVSGPSGKQEFITRSTLRECYTNLNGKKISIASWKNGKTYYLIQKQSQKVGILHIPTKGKLFTYKGKRLMPGSYFVCNMEESGEIDYESGEQISPKMFKKMFISLEGKARLSKKYSNSMNSKIRNRIKKDDRLDTVPNKLAPELQARMDKANDSRPIQKEVELKVNTESKLRVIAKLMSGSRLVGYVISNGHTERNFTLAQVKALCKERKLRNMSLVTKDGKEFLRGIGITHESLPSRYV